MADLKLKNYTTSIPAERTILEIEKLLADFGARTVVKEYLEDGRAHFLAFKIGGNLTYKLPANISGVYNVIYGNKTSRRGRGTKQSREQQAYRVAWRIIKDWLHAQLSLIESGQGNPEQVLLAYAYDGKRTLYEAWVENGRLLKGREEK